MAGITISDLDENVQRRLQWRAAEHGCSIEEEARAILRESVADDTEPLDLAAFIRSCFAPLGGVELELPPREPMSEPLDFD